MAKQMLIDASHPEETRVVVVNDRQLEEFDLESSTKKQLKGNIYLAKVTRVEPSLQAAFVEYGGQRHGFLAFSEIHPDYYQIPQADRRLLEQADRAEAARVEAAQEGNGAAAAGDGGGEADGEGAGETVAVATDPDEETAEVIDEQARRRSQLLRGYKIQEVIKRRQILLVQVVKEERGTKGAALTTYLSLAGRYCVLMPNTARGGGISRKISNPADRSRLKAIAREIKVPEGMGLIIRTAGQERNKIEIKRDYEYLLRLWNDIRELTLRSIAPCTIHEEGALVQRAIRDLYGRDVDEVLVEGEEGYRAARKVMGMLMPSRSRRVRLYKDDVPLFHRFEVEDALDAMHSPVVQLRSGGSIVIHTTEALTAIDVNSGRSTRERNIEETALKTNLEAADEIARQLRLRDVAGLVVIDFIDMGEMRNQRAVERRFREALKADRARVQVGRLSAFGLLELSRQRLRPSFQELSSQLCPVCKGLGSIRSTESAALQALRGLELTGMKGASAVVRIALPLPVALYLMNQKRERLVGLEQRYAMAIEVAVEAELVAGDYRLETLEARAAPDRAVGEAPAPEAAAPEAVEVEAEPAAEAPAAAAPSRPGAAAAAEEDVDAAGKRRRRRRRRRRKTPEGEVETVARANGQADDMSAPAEEPEEIDQPEPVEAERVEPSDADQPIAAEAPAPEPEAAVSADQPLEVAAEERKPRRRRARRTKDRAETPEVAEAAAPVEAAPAEERKPRRRRRKAAPAGESEGAAAPAEEAETAPPASPPPPAEPVTPAAEREPEPAAAAGEAADEDAEVADEAPEPELPDAAVVDQEGGGSPRRGWWSRFVRKDE
jgi:ribonuclease E